jgi:hypothetical protein
MDIRKISLLLAEAVDAWRIVPRIVLVSYAWLVYQLYLWYTKIPTYVQEQCNSEVLQTLVAAGIALNDAKNLACSVMDVVGGPTAAQSAFVTTIIGLSTGIFGLYTATGRRWDGNTTPQQPINNVTIVQPPVNPQPADVVVDNGPQP